MATKELTVKELKKIIADLSDDTLVVLSNDIAGNEFSPLCAYTVGKYIFGLKSWQKGDFYDENDQMSSNKQAQKAIALWPMH